MNKKIIKNKEKYEGKTFDSTSCGKFIVKEYRGSTEVIIKFIDTGYETITSSGHIRSGLIKYPFYPYLYGIGYIGESHRQNTESLVSFAFWRHMMDRCYKEGYNTCYSNVTVCSEWHNFSNFKKWFDDNYIKGYELDKDLYQYNKENKVYSPDFCIFLPKEINACLTTKKCNKYNLPTGIRKLNNSKFEVRVKYKNKTISARFDTIEEAENFYRVEKSKILKELTDKYKDTLEEKTQKILKNLLTK